MEQNELCDRLRMLVQDCIAKHMYSSAVFYADKLVTLSEYAPGDVFLLAQTFYVSQQYRRADALLRNHGLMEDMRFRYLAAKCMAQVEDWDEALALLGDEELEEEAGTSGDAASAMHVDDPAASCEVSLEAAVALLRGQVYEALDNRERAKRWYRAALLRDPRCEAAFTALVGCHMLTGDEELTLVNGLRLSPADQWLRLLYLCRCKKYGQALVMDAQLDELERPACSSSGSADRQEAAHTPAAAAAAGAAAAAAGAAPPMPGAAAHPRPQQPLQQKQQENKQPAAQRLPPLSAARTTRSKLKQQQQQPQAGGGLPATAEAPSARSSDDAAMESPDGSGAYASPPGSLGGGHSSGGGVSGAAAAVAAGPGWGLGTNVAVLAARAEWAYHTGDFEACHALTAAVLQRDPYALEVLPVHLASAVQLGKKNELFLRGHKLVEEHPTMGLSWFAVGCYYAATRQHEAARRHFARATQLDRNLAPAWVGLGHAYAAQDEADQAMGAYRTAARLFPGLHIPLLGMGMEYGRMNNMQLAERCFLEAHRLCPGDPAVSHELGVLAFRNQQYEEAAGWLRRALDLAPLQRPAAAEPTLVALGHVLRKQGSYGEAAALYERALGLDPIQGGTWAALAFAQQLAGDGAAAITAYHQALGLRPDDAFANDMLGEALQAECLRFSSELIMSDPSPGPGGAGLGAGGSPGAMML